MRVRTAGELARLIRHGGEDCRLDGPDESLIGPDVVIDNRQVSPGALFIGLPGERVDGARFAPHAIQAGAGAVMAQHAVEASPLLQVHDAVQGLSALARSIVQAEIDRGLVTIAITGSSGKTSTKDLLAQILELAGPTVSPIGNHNNEIGVPLTACAVDETTQFLVSEMGARGLGHIAWLCSMVPPKVAAVLNVGTAHLGEFGSQDGIAQAKGEIIEALPADGWAVLNADDPRVAAMSGRTSAHCAFWSAQAQPEGELAVWATQISADALERVSFTLNTHSTNNHSAQLDDHLPVQLKLIGEHQVLNALAAATMALAAGVGSRVVAQGLNQATTRSPLRMELHETSSGAAIINDCYNANPDSTRAALQTLARMGQARKAENHDARSIAVLGDMAELGDTASSLHHQMGELAATLGIDELIGVGEYADDIVDGAVAGGARAQSASKKDVAGLIELHPGDVVLVKASRVLALEDVTAELLSADSSTEREGRAR